MSQLSNVHSGGSKKKNAVPQCVQGRAFFNMQTRGATAPLVTLHSPPSDPSWPTSKLVGGGGISRSIMFELYSHILDYKLQFSNGVCVLLV